jgi:hypothetical protein
MTRWYGLLSTSTALVSVSPVIASVLSGAALFAAESKDAKQSRHCRMEIASSQTALLAMTF